MKALTVVAVAALLAICSYALPAGADKASEADEVNELAKLLQDRLPPEAIRDEMQCDGNGFRVGSADVGEMAPVDADVAKSGLRLKPTGDRFQTVSVRAPGVFGVVVEKGRPISTGGALVVTSRVSGKPLLSVSDSNGDGRLDGLRYEVLDASGKALYEVEDYDVDGQPDVRLSHTELALDIWHINQWYRVTRRDGRRGIVVGGRFVDVRRENGRYYVAPGAE